MGPLHSLERCTYVPSEMSSRSLHKPYIVAEGHAMKIMHTHNSSRGTKHSTSKSMWCGNFAKIHIDWLPMHLIVEEDYPST